MSDDYLEKRRATDPVIGALREEVVCVKKEVAELKGQTGRFEKDLRANTRLTKKIARDTSQFRGLLSTGKTTVGVLCTAAQVWRFLVRFVVLPIAVALAFVQWVMHGFILPPWFDALKSLFF